MGTNARYSNITHYVIVPTDNDTSKIKIEMIMNPIPPQLWTKDKITLNEYRNTKIYLKYYEK